MPISKHRKKNTRKKVTSPTSFKGDEVILMKHPLSTLPRDVVIKGLLETGKKNIEEFPCLLLKIETILGSVDPVLAISILVTYGLFGGMDKNGHVSHGYKDEKFSQSHIELIQALSLRIQRKKVSRNIPTPDVIQQLFDLTIELAEAYRLRRLSELGGGEKSSDEHSAYLIQEELRLHTQTVRNWGYLSKVITITKNLCSPIDEVFKQKINIKATELIDLFCHLMKRSAKLVNKHLNNLRPAITAHTIEETLEAYYSTHSHLVDAKERMLAFSKEQGIPLDTIKAMMISHADLALADIYTFDIESITKETGLSIESVEHALNYLSIGLGELSDENPEYLFLKNPVWTKPIIKLDDGDYFCVLPQAFFSFIFPTLADLLDGDNKAMISYRERRAIFLESEISKLFTNAFPDCEINSGYKWRDGAIEYENDLMIRIDSHLILIEAKSHSISWQALRGAPKRAQKHVEEILLSPSIQSLRLKNKVTEALHDLNIRKSHLPDFPISLDHVRTVLRLSVTLEDFATLQTMIHHTKKAGWIPPEHEIAPCILLADLEVVFEILETTPQKIHYLKRRAELEANLDYKADELDLLGFYLNTGFNIGEAEFAGDHYLLTGMSKPIDHYFEALEEGVVTAKPKPKMTQWWSDICSKIQTRNIHQWSDIANILLNVSYSDQELLAKKFKTIIKNVHKNWRTEQHLCSIIMIPHKRRADALAIFAFKEQYKDERHSRIENIASEIFATSHVERCLVIGINIDKMHYPYSLLSVYFRSNQFGELQ